MTRPVRIAIAGAGRFGALHLETFADLPAEVVAVAEPDAGRRAEVMARYRIARGYPALDALLAAEDVDLVDVAADEARHGGLVLAALRAGAHVFVEKPLALDPADAAAIEAEAGRRGLAVVAGQISRFAAGYAHIRGLLASGALGDPVHLRFRRDFSRTWFPAFGDRVHPVWESGIHDIDLALWFAGAPCVSGYAVQRSVSGRAHPDLFAATLEFANGVVATIESAWLVPEGAPQTLRGALDLEGTIDATAEVLGTRGTASYRLANDGLAVRTDDAVAHPELTLWPTVAGKIGGALREELAYAVDVAAGVRGNDLMPLGEAVEGVRIAAAIERTGARGGPLDLAKEGPVRGQDAEADRVGIGRDQGAEPDRSAPGANGRRP
ncbi:myo-inositol 2-dehydrogenase/D-chiro-inositol 1-dehydrogenase [Murinocardiopsis flavida]|uniref:Myo-inositol 2-dehydrogenase/D-chiro-inositol 1-dehydrogenase n=1 Tax=Murinocardiopsis flavida TaxID=645275 RepID=A0A2P8CXI8_9ACTN|nr:Gfo/Idh/MocA family oxidoreductase [Murinocardiopsis flavida]PSK89695.1 myo-inositol 2-dehydrogenase/D-chiro-inositol 1-dehydrogenase [Murinocardiopsis flavida]